MTDIEKYRLTEQEAANYFLTHKLLTEKRQTLIELNKEVELLNKDLYEQYRAQSNKNKLKDTDIIGKIDKDEKGFYFTLMGDSK